MASGDKFCGSCGSALFANDKFCRECGVDLEQREPVADDAKAKSTSARGRKPKAVKATPVVVADVPEVSVDFLGAIQLGFQHYADFDDRASRPEFWWWFLFTVLGGGAVGFVDAFLSGGIILFIFCLFVFLPTLAVTARRLRDVNRSPWWVLGSFIPIVSIMVMIYCIDETYVPSQTFIYDQVTGKSLGKFTKIPASFETEAVRRKALEEETQTIIRSYGAEAARKRKEEE
jgi:uncharacterized membrane protein YhaH (DUF805 family)